MASSATARLSPTIRSSRSTRWTGMTSPKSPPGGSPATPCRVMAACRSGAPTDPANWFRQLRGPLSYAPSPTASKRLSFHIHRRQQRWLRRRGDGRDHARTGNAGTVDRWNGTAGGVSQAALSLGSRSDRIWRSSFPTTRTFFNTSDLTTPFSEHVLIFHQTLPLCNLGRMRHPRLEKVGGKCHQPKLFRDCLANHSRATATAFRRGALGLVVLVLAQRSSLCPFRHATRRLIWQRVRWRLAERAAILKAPQDGFICVVPNERSHPHPVRP